eukprot:CAMPEP_0117447602 /NCGR_PEP_ID=MMETSP0759-20121206/6962_1 /TAXON_ID=63605 /ORGANISM="Percolomonas cosmopolitus, Strain WS" /LENGTH=109 /DNA_ID=CAMNT_0005239947 /DNA_START=150 /DNA_END=479 /DNA_ORIENTATION=+
MPKAKELRTVADKMVTITKGNPNTAKRLLKRWIFEDELVEKALREFPVRFAGRNGGYTRVIPHLVNRRGDGAKMATIQYVSEDVSDDAGRSFFSARWKRKVERVEVEQI